MTREEMEQEARAIIRLAEDGLFGAAETNCLAALQRAYEAGVMFYARRGYQQGRESMREEAARAVEREDYKELLPEDFGDDDDARIASYIRAIPIEGEEKP